MGNKIRIILALVLMVGVAFWAIDGVRQRSYAGSGLSFKVGSGHAVVTNLGSEAMPVEMRTEGRTSSFRIESAALGLRETSKRQGSGSSAYHAVTFELPPGQAQINVTRGSGVQFVAPAEGRIQAVVAPKDAGSARNTLVFAGLVIVGGLYYISRTLEHRWVGTVRAKLPKINLRPRRTGA